MQMSDMISVISMFVMVTISVITMLYTSCENRKMFREQSKLQYKPYFCLTKLKFKRRKKGYATEMSVDNYDKLVGQTKENPLDITLKNIGPGIAKNILFFTVTSEKKKIDQFYREGNLSVDSKESMTVKVMLKTRYKIAGNTRLILFYQDINGNIYSLQLDFRIIWKKYKCIIEGISREPIMYNKRNKNQNKLLNKYLDYCGK